MTLRTVEGTPTIGNLSAKEIILDLYERRDQITHIQGAISCVENGNEVALVIANDMEQGRALLLAKIVQLEIDMSILSTYGPGVDPLDPPPAS